MFITLKVLSNFAGFAVNSSPSTFEEFVARAGDIYTLPAVAHRVLELVDDPHVDPTDLKNCIECDAALTAKILRVVNSALFGLSGRVENLTQAIALLGLAPLKLLVLGFSLPPKLEESLQGEVLTTHWRVSLTRAVAARALATRYFDVPADDAFTAALLADIGKLVLHAELGEKFGELMQTCYENGSNPSKHLRSSIGFDDSELTAGLLLSWNLPRQMAAAVESLAERWHCDANNHLRGELARSVVLAGLVADVIENHAIAALPQLHELSEAWLGAKHTDLMQRIDQIDSERRELAASLQIDGVSFDNDELMLAAYQRLAAEAESMLSRGALNHTSAELLQLGESLENRLRHPRATNESIKESASAPVERDARVKLKKAIAQAVMRCRGEQNSLSLLLVAAELPEAPVQSQGLVPAALALAFEDELGELQPQILQLDRTSIAVIVPGADRHHVRSVANQIVGEFERSGARALGDVEMDVIDIGIAGAEVVSRSFDTAQMIAGAEGCLSAARSTERSSVKSIEVY